MKSAYIFFFLLLCKITSAQLVDLTGAIIIGKAEMMSYKLVYEINEQNQVTGYSISDVNGVTETKAKITGEYNPRKKTLRFEEKSILNTKTKLAPTEFCLMSVKGKFEKKGGKTLFTGSFLSSSSNKKLICDSGTLILATTQEIKEMVTKAAGKTSNKQQADPMAADLAPLLGVSKVKSLEPGSVADYSLLSDTVQLDVLDDRLEDGDMISIYQNKTRLITDFVTTNKVKTFKFPVARNEDIVVFTVVACNEGKSPPNTIKVVLTNGEQKELLIAQLKKGQHIKIQLKR